MDNSVCCKVILCNTVNYRHFKGTCSLHLTRVSTNKFSTLQMLTAGSSKVSVNFASLHSVISQNRARCVLYVTISDLTRWRKYTCGCCNGKINHKIWFLLHEPPTHKITIFQSVTLRSLVDMFRRFEIYDFTSKTWPASWSSGQGLCLLIMKSRVRFPVLPWEFFLARKDSRGDHGLGS